MIIITCPNCSISYRVERHAVGDQDRMVRCTRCGESWTYRVGEGSCQTFDPGKKEKKISDSGEDQGSELRPRSAANPVVNNPTIKKKKQSLHSIKTRKYIPRMLWLGFVAVFALTCAGFYLKRDQIVKRIPIIKPYLDLLGLETRDIDRFFKISEVKLRVEQQAAISNQMVDFSIKNITNQIRPLPRLEAIVLDSDRNILDSWKIVLQGASLKPGEKRIFSKEIQQSLPVGKSLKLILSSKD